MSDKPKLSPFQFHTGYEVETTGDQHVMDCPFCGGEQSFHYNEDNLWDCKKGKCQSSGNVFSFIRQLYDKFDNATRTAEEIAELRGLPREACKNAKAKFNHYNNSIIIPTYKDGKVYNLYKVIKQKKFDEKKGSFTDKTMILATPGIEHMIMNWDDAVHDELWVVEGHWDKIAGMAIAGTTKPISVVAVPGAGVWKQSWNELLDGKDVVFIYDNDDRGRAGFERVIIKEIANSRYKPASIRYMSWPTDKPDGYDLNDLYKDERRQSYNFVKDNIKEYSTPENMVVVKETIETIVPDKSCDSFDKLLDKFRETYHVTPDMELGLACLLASIYSNKVEGEQLWYKIIGPPGCGKTTLAKIASSSDSVVLKSTFTGLFSGWKDDGGEDASMIPLIANKMLVVKDADALLQQSNVEKIFSELRDFYDKDSSTQYKNMVSHDYRNIRSTMVLCGTNVLRRADSSFLGERFLDYELRLTRDDEKQIKMKMLDKSEKAAFEDTGQPPDTALFAAAKGFIDHHLMERNIEIRPSQEVKQMIFDIGGLVAQMRTKVDRDSMGKGEVTFAPTIEVPSRLIGQLMKLAICLPVVTGNADWVTRAVRKITTDIIDPTCRRFRICQVLFEGMFDRDQIVEATDLTRTTTTRELDDLRHLNLLDIERRPSPTGHGRKRAYMTLREEVKEGMLLLGL